jgi:hypothetical protein
MKAGTRPAANFTGHVSRNGSVLKSGTQGCSSTCSAVAHAAATKSMARMAPRWIKACTGLRMSGYRRPKRITMGVARAQGSQASVKAKNILTHE